MRTCILPVMSTRSNSTPMLARTCRKQKGGRRSPRSSPGAAGKQRPAQYRIRAAPARRESGTHEPLDTRAPLGIRACDTGCRSGHNPHGIRRRTTAVARRMSSSSTASIDAVDSTTMTAKLEQLDITSAGGASRDAPAVPRPSITRRSASRRPKSRSHPRTKPARRSPRHGPRFPNGPKRRRCAARASCSASGSLLSGIRTNSRRS